MPISKRELKMHKKFDPKRDYVFITKSGISVTVFRRPDPEHMKHAFNSPALPRPKLTKYNSYFVTNHRVTRLVLLIMSVASVYLFSGLISEHAITAIYAAGLFIKYIAQLLLT